MSGLVPFNRNSLSYSMSFSTSALEDLYHMFDGFLAPCCWVHLL